jgi:hypothetical protein
VLQVLLANLIGYTTAPPIQRTTALSVADTAELAEHAKANSVPCVSSRSSRPGAYGGGSGCAHRKPATARLTKARVRSGPPHPPPRSADTNERLSRASSGRRVHAGQARLPP